MDTQHNELHDNRECKIHGAFTKFDDSKQENVCANCGQVIQPSTSPTPVSRTAEEILKSKLDPKIIILNNPDYTFNKVIDAMEEYKNQFVGTQPEEREERVRIAGEWIICAANWYNDGEKHEHQPKNITEGFITCGRRHHNCIGTFAQIVGFPYTEIGHKIHETEQHGFLTNTNRFVSRKEAFQIARLANQIHGPNKGQQENSIGLTSEDLY